MRSRMSFIRRCATRKPENSRWPTLAQERTAANSSLPLRRRRTSMTAIPSLARSSRDRTWPTRSPTCRAIRATVRARPWSSKRSKSNAWPDGAQGDAHSRPPFPPDHGDDFSSPRRSARLAGTVGPIVFRPALARLGDCERRAHPVGATRALQSRRVVGALAELDEGTFARACRCDDGGDCARAVSVGRAAARVRGPVAYGARNPRLASFPPAALNAFLSLRRLSLTIFGNASRVAGRPSRIGRERVAEARFSWACRRCACAYWFRGVRANAQQPRLRGPRPFPFALPAAQSAPRRGDAALRAQELRSSAAKAGAVGLLRWS